jgi:site-specific recombinase XerD
MTSEPTPLPELAAEFLAVQKNLVSAQGLRSLEVLTHKLIRWLEEEELDPLEVSISDATGCMARWAQAVGGEGRPYASGTLHNHLKAARKFFGYLVNLGLRQTNPFMEVDPPRHGESLSRNVLTEAQMGRLLSDLGRFDREATVKGRKRAYRVHVIAEFLYATGLRIEEACSLTRDNLDLEHRLVYLPRGKGERPRTAFLTGYAAQVMELYLKSGRRAVTSELVNGTSLWGASCGRIMILVNGELHRRCAALELPVITTHGFRHSLGTHLLRSGCDMRHIQVILGHECLATTQIYTRVDKEDLKKSLDEFHPRRWHTKGEASWSPS